MVKYYFLVAEKVYNEFPDDYEIKSNIVKAIDFVRRDGYFEVLITDDTVTLLPDSIVIAVAQATFTD